MYSAVTYKGMTVMCLIQGFDLLSHDKLDVHSIAASQMVAAKQVVLYTRGGRNYYGKALVLFTTVLAAPMGECEAVVLL
jgi:hypothetical protein